MDSEPAFLALGHSDAVLFEDVAAFVLFCAAGLCYPLLRRRTAWTKLFSLLLLAASLLVGIQFIAQLGILSTENQFLLSDSGKSIRVLEVVVTALCGFWAALLGVLSWPSAESSIST